MSLSKDIELFKGCRVRSQSRLTRRIVVLFEDEADNVGRFPRRQNPGTVHRHRLGDLLPAQVAMIGDRLDTDVVGGQRAGLRTILVLTGVTTAAEARAASSQPDAIAADLAAVAGLLGWR